MALVPETSWAAAGGLGAVAARAALSQMFGGRNGFKCPLSGEKVPSFRDLWSPLGLLQGRDIILRATVTASREPEPWLAPELQGVRVGQGHWGHSVGTQDSDTETAAASTEVVVGLWPCWGSCQCSCSVPSSGVCPGSSGCRPAGGADLGRCIHSLCSFPCEGLLSLLLLMGFQGSGPAQWSGSQGPLRVPKCQVWETQAALVTVSFTCCLWLQS